MPNVTTPQRQTPEDLGPAIRALKLALNMSWDRLSKHLDVNMRGLLLWKSGRTRPNAEHFARLVAACPDAETRALFFDGGNGDSRFQIPNSEASRDTAGGGSLPGIHDMTPPTAEPAPPTGLSETHPEEVSKGV